MPFNSRLQKVMDDTGLTRRQVSLLFGIPEAGVNRWLVGGNVPMPAYQEIIIQALQKEDPRRVRHAVCTEAGCDCVRGRS